MDVVLFGYRLPGSGYVKDIVLILLLAFFISTRLKGEGGGEREVEGLYAVSRYQRASAQKQNKQLASQMEKLRGMELHFHELQSKYVSS